MAGGDDDNNGQGRSSARKCLDEMARNVAALLTKQEILESSFARMHKEYHAEMQACRADVSAIHTRISDVRKDLSQLHVELAAAISYSKGSRAVWGRVSGPIIAAFSIALGALLVYVGTHLAGG